MKKTILITALFVFIPLASVQAERSLTADLDASSPASHSILAGSVGNEMVRVRLTAVEEDISVTSLYVAGSGWSDDVSYLYVYEGDTLISNFTGMTGLLAYFSFANPIKIPANTSKVISVKADLSPKATPGHTLSFGVSAISAIANSDQYKVSVYGGSTSGNTMTIKGAEATSYPEKPTVGPIDMAPAIKYAQAKAENQTNTVVAGEPLSIYGSNFRGLYNSIPYVFLGDTQAKVQQASDSYLYITTPYLPYSGTYGLYVQNDKGISNTIKVYVEKRPYTGDTEGPVKPEQPVFEIQKPVVIQTSDAELQKKIVELQTLLMQLIQQLIVLLQQQQVR